MNPTHVHLLITHLPIFGSILGAIVLVYGLATKTQQTLVAAYLLFVLSGIGSFIANQTGEAAEETVEHMQGISERLVHEHEESAEVTVVAMAILAVLSVIAMILIFRKSSFSFSFAGVIFVLSLICFGLAARTGYLGGQIRHTEIALATAANGAHGDQDDD
jgi:uncharacterized membrane protein